MDEIAFVRNATYGPSQVAAIRAMLRREFDKNSQENSYFLNQIARRYQDGDGATVAAVDNLTEQIGVLSGSMLQQAAASYLSLDHYVKVTQVPETK
jgi:hypothetical protein